MIDSPDRNPNRSDAPSDDAKMEEARLRQQAIGAKLRHMFDEVINEPVPDAFLEILRRADTDRADAQEANSLKAGGDKT